MDNQQPFLGQKELWGAILIIAMSLSGINPLGFACVIAIVVGLISGFFGVITEGYKIFEDFEVHEVLYSIGGALVKPGMVGFIFTLGVGIVKRLAAQ